jgi:hypothetical protein
MIQFFIIFCPGTAGYDRGLIFAKMIDGCTGVKLPAILITRSKRVSPPIITCSE